MRDSIQRYLSEPRFGRYLSLCDDDFERALSLYEANIRLSGAAMEAINIVEVTLRNAIDQQLRVWSAERVGTESWTTLPTGALASVLNDGNELRKAKEKATKALKQKRDPLHDDIVAQLNFGTWAYLLPSALPANSRHYSAKHTLWTGGLQDAFPMRHNVRPEQIKESVRIVYDLRNRVAHFEPIFSLYLEGKRSAMAKVLHMINRPVKKWFTETERFSVEVEKFRSEWPSFASSPNSQKHHL